ncbi:hypothetical protein P6U16_12730 [Rhizobium sp. 32-5/1]|uniref:hypothetical protein n=1 Tax=Rhizobium sp. 32-5/1 TaxID=3019602 RepID=UPI00240DE527|nr:hypothetical protein [Rhizobium sp. 32-5/1]WEZ82085.1 hypothetical protein P6U16_12730 [Rhizobium sp. 32-5/1]
MPAEFTDYEKRLSASHERHCRIIATKYRLWRICRTRKCARDLACTGAMLVSPHQNATVRVQREIGLSGNACSRLPACIANLNQTAFDSFEERMTALQKFLIEHPKYRLPKFDRCLKGRRVAPAASATLDFPARSSDFKETNGQGRTR